MTYDPNYVVKESDLLTTGATEHDDFDPDIAEWADVTSAYDPRIDEGPDPDIDYGSQDSLIVKLAKLSLIWISWSRWRASLVPSPALSGCPASGLPI